MTLARVLRQNVLLLPQEQKAARVSKTTRIITEAGGCQAFVSIESYQP